ncbi:MAG: hypothetical protein KatS3mg121_1065 [Gammaproteobacteria bacterium]|nr:MAG: hypothetical protein KatS3mg121_1065 [Gammaproteobacteria bacterium]
MALAPIGALYRTLLFLLPYLLVIAAFTFLYVFLPNTAVRWRAALAGGLAAGLLWQSAGWVFTTFVGQAGRYTAIYSGFAVLILGMLWIYLNWLILLIGAQFAYFVQHPRRLRRPPQVAAPVWVDEWTALAVYAAVARAWYADRGGAAATVLALELDLDEQQVEDALALLSRTGWLDERVEAPGVFLPLSPPERHDALELYRAVHAARAPEAAVVRALRARYDQCLHECLSRLSLRDLAQGEDAAAAMDTSKGIRGDDERLA